MEGVGVSFCGVVDARGMLGACGSDYGAGGRVLVAEVVAVVGLGQVLSWFGVCV